MLAEHDVAVAHCPRSNALLGLGIAPVADLLAAGVRVGIGTDSPASTPSFDMFEELRTAVALARLRSRGSNAMSSERVLELATLARRRRSAWTTSSARSSPASKPTSPSSASKARRTCRGRIRPPPWSWAAPRREYC